MSHPALQARIANLPVDQYNFHIYTDGSGHEDGYGGYGAVVINHRERIGVTLAGAANGTSVYRQELSAVLAGLHVVSRWADRYPQTDTISVRVVIDNESVALAMARDKETGKPIYQRNTGDNDLWAAYKYFESKLLIIPEHISRDKGGPFHASADVMASEMRMVVKNYAECMPHMMSASNSAIFSEENYKNCIEKSTQQLHV